MDTNFFLSCEVLFKLEKYFYFQSKLIDKMLSSTEWLQKSLAQILEESLRIEEPSVPRIEEPTQIVKDVKVCQKARFLRILDKVLSETSSVNDLRPAPQDAKCENCQKVTALASPIYLPMLSICINKCYPC